jgi:hypothetical protein
LGDRATLVLKRYPQVNAPIRTNTKGQEIFTDVIYGKQSLTDADRGLGAATTPIAEGCERRIEPSSNRSPAAEYPRGASSTGRYR